MLSGILGFGFKIVCESAQGVSLEQVPIMYELQNSIRYYMGIRLECSALCNSKKISFEISWNSDIHKKNVEMEVNENFFKISKTKQPNLSHHSDFHDKIAGIWVNTSLAAQGALAQWL